MSEIYKQIVNTNQNILGGNLTDTNLPEFFQSCFQGIMEERGLWPAWVCMNCQEIRYGDKPKSCPDCQSQNIYFIGNFQGRGTITGRVFEEAVKFVLKKYFPDLGVEDSDGTEFQHHCDLFVPEVAGIEIKGSPALLILPNGDIIKFNRPGMKRSDTEKKANSNATTFKADYQSKGFETRFYVLTNAIPKGWQEAISGIDEIFDVTKVGQWEDFAYDIDVDKRRAGRDRIGRR